MLYFLLALPFILIFNYKDKVSNIFKIFSIYCLYIVSVSLCLQYFNIFTFSYVLSSLILCAFITLIIFLRKEKFFKISVKSFDYISMFIFSIFLLYLFLPNIIENKFAFYPIYSDEWVNFGLINNSVINNSLPIYNYLDHNKFFINILIPFHTFISFFVLYFNLNIEGYVVLGKFFNFLILIAVFVLIKKNNINNLAALFAITVMLFINNSNATSLWSFIPINLSFLFLIISFLNFRHVNSFLSLLFYPPMGIIILFRYVYLYRYLAYKYIFYLSSVFVLLLNINSPFQIYVQKIFDLLIRPSAYSFNENISIFNMFPWFITPIILIGIIIQFKNKKNTDYLFILLICILFWIYYSLYNTIIVIDKVRVITITAWLLILPISFGFNYLINKLNIKKQKYFYIALLLFLILNVKTYAKNNNYDTKISNQYYSSIVSKDSESVYDQKDIDIFNKYVGKEKVFLSTPWKSLIISTVTDNTPMLSKSSYLGVNKVNYDTFVKKPCKYKDKIFIKNKIDFFYGKKINCPNFLLIHSQADNDKPFLYRFVNNSKK